MTIRTTERTSERGPAERGPAERGPVGALTAAQLPTVESVTEQAMSELAASLGVLMTALGTRSGLWLAMAGAGAVTPGQIAAQVGVATPLVREWMRSQAAAGYLRYDPPTSTFELPDAVASAVVDGPVGPVVDACLEMMGAMAVRFDDYVEAFRGDGGYGWHRLGEQHWQATSSLGRVFYPPELIAAVTEQLGPVSRALSDGGSIVDVGCGFGAPTIALARHYPRSRVLGVDYHDVSVRRARERSVDAGVGDRVRFEVASAADLPGSGYTLITFFDSLHDLGDPVGALVRAREALCDDGSVLLFEPMAADRVEDNLTPSGRMLYAVSTLVCTPNALAQQGTDAVEPLGTQAGESRLRAVAEAAGFRTVRRIGLEAPMNLVLELRP